MKTAIYPGSFDPVTLGHLDIIKRSSQLADNLIVGVLNNNTKTPLFSVEERVTMLKEVTKELGNVQVMSFTGLLVDFAREQNVQVIIRGLRAVTDFEYEFQLAAGNEYIDNNIDWIRNVHFLYPQKDLYPAHRCLYGSPARSVVPVAAVSLSCLSLTSTAPVLHSRIR